MSKKKKEKTVCGSTLAIKPKENKPKDTPSFGEIITKISKVKPPKNKTT